MSTLRDLYEYLDRNMGKLVIYRQITTHLQNTLISTDAVSASTTLQLDDGRAVPEELVEEVIVELRNKHIADLEERIRDLMDTELDATLDKIREAKKAERQADEDVEAAPPKLNDRKKAAVPSGQ